MLGPRTSAGRHGVVRHIGAGSELFALHVFELDENLLSTRKYTNSSGPHRIAASILHVRALGEWVIELRP